MTLQEAEAAYRAAAAQAEQLRKARNALVLKALEDGMTHAAISELTGLTRGRIGQIKHSL